MSVDIEENPGKTHLRDNHIRLPADSDSLRDVATGWAYIHRCGWRFACQGGWITSELGDCAGICLGMAAKAVRWLDGIGDNSIAATTAHEKTLSTNFVPFIDHLQHFLEMFWLTSEPR